jgi:TRAP-type C4-dicarboxylate transport system substrate-binding protein
MSQSKMLTKLTFAPLVVWALVAQTMPATAEELSLAYFMGSGHPMNEAIFTPFAETLERESDGTVTVRQYPGGVLSTSPSRQYSMLLDQIADVAFVVPGYTSDVFPKTNVVSLPDVCDTAPDCTDALLRARSTLEEEYNAVILAIWANAPPVLITRDTPVRTLADLEGMIIRVGNANAVPFIEALGATAEAQPASLMNQNLANGLIDGILIDPSAIQSFSLHEPANYVTTWFPGSGSAFTLLMNRDSYDALDPHARAAIDAAATDDLSRMAGVYYADAGQKALDFARAEGLEMIDLDDTVKAQIQEIVDATMVGIVSGAAGDMTIADVIRLMKEG